MSLDPAVPANDASAGRDLGGRLRWVAALLALAGIATGGAALVGYLRHEPMLVQVRPGLQGMSPVTAMGLLAAASAVLSQAMRARRIASLAGGGCAAVGAAMLLIHALTGQDSVSAWLAGALFSAPAATVGRTSVATAACLLAIGVSNLRSLRAGELGATLALVVSGVALLGYAYGVRDLYALPLFRTMALNTALALFALSAGSLLADPESGWVSVIASREDGGGATRRQLAFLLLPPLAGWALLRATSAQTLGPGTAMALLVMVTVIPLAILILRDGRLLNTLEAERRTKAELQARVQGDLERRLAEQANKLAAESGQRAKAEAALSRAQRMEAVGQLTGGIAHDFNNLLMAVGGNLQLLTKRLAEDHPARRFALNAAEAVDRGAKLTAQLLAFSRTQRLEARSVEVDPVLTSARKLIGANLGPQIEIRLDCQAPGAWALTDPDQLELAILNLALNARDAMAEGGVLTITSGPCRERLSPEGDDADYVSVRVSDTGPGMSPEVADRAVEPFFTTKERGKGTGLGLAQVYGFVRQCGGDLRIERAPGGGASIQLLFPCAAPAPPVAEAAAPAAGPPTPAVGMVRSLLVIDDDDAVRSVLGSVEI